MNKNLTLLMAFSLIFGNLSLSAQRDSRLSKIEKYLNTKNQRETIWEPQEAVYSKIEGNSTEEYQDLFTYDEDELNLIYRNTNKKINGLWTNYKQVEYSYGWIGYDEILEQEWNGNDWENETLTSFSYNGSELAEVTEQEWEDGDWVNESNMSYTFNGEVTTIVYREWSGSSWVNKMQYVMQPVYIYEDAANEILIQDFIGGAWINNTLITQTLNAENQITSELVQIWENNEWHGYEQSNYSYSQGLQTEILRESWSGNGWENDEMQTFTYENGNAVNGICKMWNGNSWVDGNGDVAMIYGENTLEFEEILHEVNVTYTDITNVEESFENQTFSIYPNPSSGTIYIEGNDFIKAEAYTVSGQLVETFNTNVIDLGSGVYMIKIINGKGNSEMRKVVVR